MKIIIITAVLIIAAILSGCASAIRGTPDQVTIHHGTAAYNSTVYAEAEQYCRRYGKVASFRARFSSTDAVFDCK